MSLIDSSNTLDPAANPWAPKTQLAPPPMPAAPQPQTPAVKPAAPAQAAAPARITPETHPHFFEAPTTAAAQPAAAPTGQMAIPQYMAAVRKHESGGNDLAGNGTAFGRYQFTPQTWLGVAASHPELGLRPEDIWNGDKQDRAMQALTADNAKVLEQHGIPADSPNLFMMHFLGTGSGPKFLKAMQADASANAAAMFPLEAKYNPTIFHEKDGQPRSLGQIYALMTKNFGGNQMAGAAPIPPGNGVEPGAGAPLSSSAPLIEGRAAAEEPEALPPLPEGAKPIAAAAAIPAPNLPPLPPGAKPITPEGAYEQDIHKGAYEKEADKGGDAPPAGLVEQFGEKQAREMWKDPLIRASVATSNATEGFLPGGRVGSEVGNVSGFLQAPLGLAENVPGPIGQGAAEADKALQQVGDPSAQSQGTLAAQLIPIGGGAAAAGQGVKSIIEDGSSFAKWATSAGEGARGGGVAAAMTPTGETDPNKRVAEKTKDLALGTGAGAVLGSVVPAAGVVAKEVGTASSKASTKAAEELRTGVAKKTGEVLGEAGGAADRASERKGLEELKAEMEERAAMAQEKKAADADAARKAVIDKHAANPTKPPEAVGEEVHETAVKDMEALKKERAEKSGFDKAVKSDGGKPSVPTEKFIASARALEEKTKSPELKEALETFRKSLTNNPSVKGQPTIKSLSIAQAREVLETMNAKIDSMSPNAAHKMTEVRDEFLKHLEETHPQMKAAREAYAKYSRPLDVYERTGALKKAVMEDPYSGKAVMDPTKIKAAVTAKTAAGADALGHLIEKNPALRDSVRQTYQHQLFGAGSAAKTPTPAQLRSFLESNRLGLEKSGLYKEFADMKTERDTVEKAFETESAKAKGMRSGGKTETQKNIDTLASSKAKSEAVKHEFSTLDTELSKAKKTSDVTSAAERTAKALVRNGHIDQAQYGEILDKVHEVEKKYEDHRKAAEMVKRVLIAGAFGVGTGVAGIETLGHYVNHRVRP